MGGCGSSEHFSEDKVGQMAVSKAIDVQLQKEKKTMVKENKLLLLGPGESGKSTIAKQVKIIHLKGFTKEERISFVSVINNNIICGLIALVESLKETGEFNQLSPELQNHAGRFNNKLEERLTPEMVTGVKQLWSEPTVRKRFGHSAEFQISESVEYFFNEIERISSQGYVPTEQDMLYARVRTSGITELCFSVGEASFRLVDVGGQRSERKKWIHCFQDVTSIIFCAAISEYDQKLREDEKTNRMEESLQLFGEICNCPWFVNTAIILFLNKSDIFYEKLKKIDLNVCFPDYTGGPDQKVAINFLKEKFNSLNKNKNKKIYIHVTCATNTENIRFVLSAVQDIVVNKSLDSMGF